MATPGTTPDQSIAGDEVARTAERILFLTDEIRSLDRLKREREAEREQLSMRLLGQTENRKQVPSPVIEEGALVKIGANYYEFTVGSRTGAALRQAWDAIYTTLPHGSPERQRMDVAYENTKSTSYLASFKLSIG